MSTKKQYLLKNVEKHGEATPYITSTTISRAASTVSSVKMISAAELVSLLVSNFGIGLLITCIIPHRDVVHRSSLPQKGVSFGSGAGTGGTGSPTAQPYSTATSRPRSANFG